MTSFARGITVTVERDDPGGHDAYGDPVDSTPTSFTVDGCAVAPRESSEVEDRGRHGVIVGLTLYAPADAGLASTDVVVIAAGDPNAGRWEIDGEPAVWVSPFTGWAPGTVAALRRATG